MLSSDIQNSLSVERMRIYEFVNGKTLNLDQAIELYTWNAQISSAFLHPIHICEVVTRNGVNRALSERFCQDWLWDNSFLRSLPQNIRKPIQKDLPSKIPIHQAIPEINFYFWEHMFTTRYNSLWKNSFNKHFPNCPKNLSESDCQKLMHTSLEKTRALRNKVAHHEPVFSRQLHDDLENIFNIVSWRCKSTETWLRKTELVSDLLKNKPII